MTPTPTPEVREYRKTATIMAVQYLGQHVDGVCTGGRSCASRGAPDDAVPHIHTLEGDLTVSQGDWIATGVQGEHWAIKPDVFAASYTLAASPQPVVAPSDLSGEFDTAEARAEAWSDRIEVRDLVDVTSAVFAKWSSPEILSRFRQQMMAVIQQAYIEGFADRTPVAQDGASA